MIAEFNAVGWMNHTYCDNSEFTPACLLAHGRLFEVLWINGGGKVVDTLFKAVDGAALGSIALISGEQGDIGVVSADRHFMNLERAEAEKNLIK